MHDIANGNAGSGNSQPTGSHPVNSLLQHPIDDSDVDVDLLELWSVIWKHKWLIAVAFVIFGGLGAAYSLIAAPWYRAEVWLMPTEKRVGSGLASQLSQLGGLAGLAGMTVGAGDKAEPVAVLKSRDFAREFIESNELVPVLLANRLDADAGRWKGPADEAPDVRDAIEFFDRKVRRVSEDRKTGIVSLVVEWTDPNQAAAWANAMARKLNDDMRARALAESAANIAFLQEQLESTNVISLQQAAGRLIESEMQKYMLAKGNEEFAFRVVDSAQVPKRHFKPQRAIVTAGAALFGMILAIAFVLARSALRGRPKGSLDSA